MKNTIKISIITINLNNKSGLKNTIESVINQDYENIEFLIIDGNSNDGSTEIIKNYLEKIYYAVSESDSGIYNAMNKGIHKSSGDFLLFLNSGDILFDNNVISKVANLILPEDEIIAGNLVENHIKKYKTRVNDSKITPELFLESGLTHQSTFVKKVLFDKYGYYNEQLYISSDLEFFVNVLLTKNTNYRMINVPICIFDMNGIGTDEKTMPIRIAERKLIFEKYFSKPVIESFEKNYINKIVTEKKWFIPILKTTYLFRFIKYKFKKIFNL
jgi:glycosyltransferase involved in cell wall biosynthesis